MRHCTRACPGSLPGLMGKTDLMPATLRFLLPLAPLAMLAACNQADEPAAPTDKRAEGEVLGGTISDAMIPLDQLRSQSPPMRVAPTEGGTPGSDDDAGDSGDTTGPAPAAEPAPEPAVPAEEG